MKRNLFNKAALLILLLSSFSLFSCSKNKTEIVLDNSDPNALSPEYNWALIIEPYAAFRKEPSWSSTVVDHCRLGDVLKIEGNMILESSIDSKAKEIWYRFEQGWLSETNVSVYQNKLKAEKVAKSMTE